MKNSIIGTAGHVDHGKTLLIKALTGIDTDRLKEEKKRGITIELGFAYLDMPNGEKAGIIDVPGHEKFIKNMLAGIGGIDIVLLVVAADEGIMPQTREHLDILSLLNIKDGIVVITKKDMVESDWLEMIKEDTKNAVKGTFLAAAPVIAVSAYTGEGIQELKQLIFEKLEVSEGKNLKAPFRVPVDRVFTIGGFGTVITGTLTEGKINLGDDAVLYPSGKQTKIRNIQVHGKTTDKAFAGQRVALNLASLSTEEVSRGDTLAFPDTLQNTLMLDVKLNIVKNCEREILNGSRLHFYYGARDVLCKLVLLDSDSLKAGEEGYAQLRFSEPVSLKEGDFFVVRYYSPIETVGGGFVLDSDASKHKRHDEKTLSELKIKEKGGTKEKLLSKLAGESKNLIPLESIRLLSGMEKDRFYNYIKEYEKEKQGVVLLERYFLGEEYINSMLDRLKKSLDEYHKNNPLQQGMPKEELKSRVFKGIEPAIADALTDVYLNRGEIKSAEKRIYLPAFKVAYSGGAKRLSDEVEKIFLEGAFSTISLDELKAKYPKEKAALKQVTDALTQNGILIFLTPQIILHKDNYEKAFALLQKHFETKSELSLGEFRDMLSTSRKYAVALLEHWDAKGITKKGTETRTLIKK